MKALITDVKVLSDKCLVSFSCKFGYGRAWWDGNRPVQNKDYYVELELNDDFQWGTNVKESLSRENCIGMREDTFYLIGQLESVDDDGYTVIRLDDSIVCLEVGGNPCSIGTFIEVHTRNIVLFDQNYV